MLGHGQTETNLSPAQIEGRALAQEILSQRPETNATRTGTLKIRDEKGDRTETPIKFEVLVTPTNWTTIYQKMLPPHLPDAYQLAVTRTGTDSPNGYLVTFAPEREPAQTSGPEAARLPFAGDFWAMDLGLEFFHWPDQKILKHEMRRGRSCKVLESTNPGPATNSYARVVSWIDNDSGGIVHAEAYDSKNELLKEFDPKSFKKVNGHWELQDMEIRNDQTGSRTRIEFDLEEK
jgi:Outer membrane lipoprotein-sorting protein